MSFFKNIIADARPRNTLFKNSPLPESPLQVMELQEERSGFQKGQSGKSDEFGNIASVEKDTSFEDYTGFEQRPKNKNKENNYKPDSQFIRELDLGNNDNLSEEKDEIHAEHQSITISEHIPSDSNNDRSFNYTIESLSKSVDMNGPVASDRELAQEHKRHWNNGTKLNQPDDMPPMQMDESLSEEVSLEETSFKPKQKIATDKKKVVGEMLKASSEVGTQQTNETILETPKKVNEDLLAGSPQYGEYKGAVELIHADLPSKLNAAKKKNMAKMYSSQISNQNVLSQRNEDNKNQDNGGQNKPQVYIGRVDVVVEAPAEAKKLSTETTIDSSDFTSRHYLRRL